MFSNATFNDPTRMFLLKLALTMIKNTDTSGEQVGKQLGGVFGCAFYLLDEKLLLRNKKNVLKLVTGIKMRW